MSERLSRLFCCSVWLFGAVHAAAPLICLATYFAATTPLLAEELSREAFSRQMMPKVGERIIITGEYVTGKNNDGIALLGGGFVELKPKNPFQANDPKDFPYGIGDLLTVTGVLRYRPAMRQPPNASSGSAGLLGETFYIPIEGAMIRRSRARAF